MLGLCPKIDYNRRPEMLLITQLCSHGCVCRVLWGSAIFTSILYTLYIHLHNIGEIAYLRLFLVKSTYFYFKMDLMLHVMV